MEEKTLIPLVKEQNSAKMFIPEDVERKIRYICQQVWNVEWSGILFYSYKGSFEKKDLVITCEDILVMDIGNSIYTGFTMSPEVISYMAENSKLLDCQMGLIHSHNNMAKIKRNYI